MRAVRHISLSCVRRSLLCTRMPHARRGGMGSLLAIPMRPVTSGAEEVPADKVAELEKRRAELEAYKRAQLEELRSQVMDPVPGAPFADADDDPPLPKSIWSQYEPPPIPKPDRHTMEDAPALEAGPDEDTLLFEESNLTDEDWYDRLAKRTEHFERIVENTDWDHLEKVGVLTRRERYERTYTESEPMLDHPKGKYKTQLSTPLNVPKRIIIPKGLGVATPVEPPPINRMPVPRIVVKARYGMTVEKFLNIIGRDCAEYAEHFPTWESLFLKNGKRMKKDGIPVKQRRWILRWVEKYRHGIEPQHIPNRSRTKPNLKKRGLL